MREIEIAIERAGAALLVRRAGTDDAAARLAHATRPESRRVGVVVGPSAAYAVLEPEVAAELGTAVREHPFGAVRLLVSRSGGAESLGSRLAVALGVEVTAPDGDLLVLDDGQLFVAGQDAAWVTHSAAGGLRRGGARSPAPWWQADLPVRVSVPGLSVTPIPVGWLVRQADAAPLPLTDPVFAVVPDAQRPILVVGAPGERTPDPARLAALVCALPKALRDIATVAVYGPDLPVSPLAQRVADELGVPVSGLHGMPGHAGDRTVLLDEEGEPTWEPFAQQSRYAPGAAPVVERWVPPVPGLTPDGQAAYRLSDGWRLDVVAAGLLVRPTGTRVDPTWSPNGSDSELVDLAVTGAGLPLDAIAGLVHKLPDDARSLLRVRSVGDTAIDLDAVRTAIGLDVAPAGAVVGRPDDDVAVDLVPAMLPREDPAPARPVTAPAAPVTERPSGPVAAMGAAAAAAAVAAAPVAPVAVDEPATEPATDVEDIDEDLDENDASDADFAAVAAPPDLVAAARPADVLVDSVGRIWPVVRGRIAPQPAVIEPPARTRSIAHDGTGPFESIVDRLGTIGEPMPTGSVGSLTTATAASAAVPSVAAPSVAPPPPRSRRQQDTAQPEPAPMPGPMHQPNPMGFPGVGEQARHQQPFGQPAPRQLHPGQLAPNQLAPHALVPGPHAPAPAQQPGPWVYGPAAFGAVVPQQDGLVAQSVGNATAPAAPANPAPAEPEAQPVVAQPEPEPEPVVPAQVVVADPATIVPTDAQRHAFRAKAGWRYDSASRAVSRVLAERPGLRSNGDAAALAELAAVRVFADDPLAGYDEAFAACLASGLRRLPTVRGAVIRGGQATGDLAVGSILRLRTPVLAVADVDAPATGSETFLVWALTARRLDGLVDDTRANEVVLAAGTRFAVLAADPPGSKPRQVLLAELPPGVDLPATSTRTRLDLLAAARTVAVQAGLADGEVPVYLAGQPLFVAA